MNQPDRLTEILGFNPDTGEIPEDRGDLRPVPEVLQREFLEAFKEFKFPTDERHFMCITPKFEDQPYEDISRKYLAYSGELSDDEKQRHLRSFALTAFLHLSSLKNGQYGYIGISRSSETENFGHRDWEGLTIDTDGGPWGDRSLEYSSYVNGESMHASYDETGFLLSARLVVYSTGKAAGFYFYRDASPPVRSIEALERSREDRETFKRLMRGELVETESNGSHFMGKVEDGVLIIRRFFGEQELDILSMPVQISPDEIKDRLIDPVILKDPINAPAELDIPWRFSNLMETIGVSWERH